MRLSAPWPLSVYRNGGKMMVVDVATQPATSAKNRPIHGLAWEGGV